MVKEKRPDMVFLMETKMRNNRMEKVRLKLDFDNMFVVDCVGRSGGLALLWTAEAGVTIQNFSRRHINAMVVSREINSPWKFTGFYGHPDTSKREEGWNLLRHIANLEPGPWVCLGDFNEILKGSEKYGGRSRPRGLMEAFQKTLEDCNLSDLGFKGPKYTWSNCQDGSALIRERLDRVVANRGWCDLFSDAEVLIGVAISSDHSPIFLHPLGTGDWRPLQRSFKYEVSWELESSYSEIIKKAWCGQQPIGDPWLNLSSKIDSCQKIFQQWRREHVDKPKRLIKKRCDQLPALQGTDNFGDMGKIAELQDDLHLHMEQEELKWRQRAKVDWLKFGDKNNKYFHACVNQRRKGNKIRNIIDEQGQKWETQKEIGIAFTNFYSNLFSTEGVQHIVEGMEAIDGRVSGDMNEALLQPFTEVEIRTALFQMAPLKALGPDGFNAGFFQKN